MAGMNGELADYVSGRFSREAFRSDTAGFYQMFQMGEDRTGSRAVHFFWQVFVQTLHDFGDRMEAVI